MLKTRKNWQKTSLLAETIDRIGLKGAARNALLLVIYGAFLVYLSGEIWFPVYCCLIVALFGLGNIINEVIYDVPRKRTPTDHSRLHTIVWSICHKGTMVTVILSAVMSNAQRGWSIFETLLWCLGLFMLFTWGDLFRFWWTERSPQKSTAHKT